MNTDLRKKAKNHAAKLTKEGIIQYQNHTTKFFTENLFAIEIQKTEIYMNKPVYFGLTIRELSKILMYDFWYDNVKPTFNEKANLGHIDTYSFIAYINSDDIYKDIAEYVETRFDTSNYKSDRPFPKGKNKK